MEIGEFGEQFSLQENQHLCVQLDYEGIVSHLMQAGVITHQENIQIQEEFVDNASRMQELISRLFKLNSEASFDAFRGAVQQLGETVLAQNLRSDQIPLNPGDAHPCLFTLDTLNKIFSYLSQHNLLIARLVCQRWNSVITDCHAQKFLANFYSTSAHKQMIEFASIGPKSSFCRRLTKFSLDFKTVEPGAWVYYKTFFVEFGSQIQVLELGGSLNRDLLALIFSLEIRQCLSNLRHLELEIVPDIERIPNESLTFLSGLETFALAEHGGTESKNCMHFLEKFLGNDHKLSVFRLELWSTYVIDLEGFPHANTILPKLFKSPSLRNITVKGLCHFDDFALGLMTFPNGGGGLKVIDCALRNVSPQVFRDFITCHRHTLHELRIKIKLCPNPVELFEALPRLEALKCLHFEGVTGGALLWYLIAKLGLCTLAPNLKSLRISELWEQAVPRPVSYPPFVHEGLEELSLRFVSRLERNLYNSDAEEILGLLSHVSQCFPNLTKLEVEDLDRGVNWPTQLSQLQLQPRSVQAGLAVWKRMDFVIQLN